VHTVVGSPDAAAGRADPHAAAPLVARAIDQKSGRAAGGDLIAAGEAEYARLESDRRADRRPFEGGLTMAASL
jgi:hypothetical protein